MGRGFLGFARNLIKFFLQASRSFLYSPGTLYPSGKREMRERVKNGGGQIRCWTTSQQKSQMYAIPESRQTDTAYTHLSDVEKAPQQLNAAAQVLVNKL